MNVRSRPSDVALPVAKHQKSHTFDGCQSSTGSLWHCTRAWWPCVFTTCRTLVRRAGKEREVVAPQQIRVHTLHESRATRLDGLAFLQSHSKTFIGRNSPHGASRLGRCRHRSSAHSSAQRSARRQLPATRRAACSVGQHSGFPTETQLRAPFPLLHDSELNRLCCFLAALLLRQCGAILVGYKKRKPFAGPTFVSQGPTTDKCSVSDSLLE